MFFTTKLFALAALALAPFTSAQSSKIQLTQIPGPATIGQASTIKWSGGDNSPVTLTLFEGSLSSPKTIGIIAANVPGNSYSWKPGTSIVPNDDFLLQISQGLDDSNYSGQFAIQNASAGQQTTIFAAAGSSTIAISTVMPNMTSAVTMAGASTTPAANASAASAASASGTGVSIARNTTFVSQSLTSTVTTGVTTATSAGSTTTTGSSSSSAGGAVARATAQGVLGFGAIAAAAMYLL